MSQYGKYPVTPEYRIDVAINKAVIAADRKLSNSIKNLECILNVHMLLLINGRDYVNDIFDAIYE